MFRQKVEISSLFTDELFTVKVHHKNIYVEKPRNNYRRCYCYHSPHPSTRFRKHNYQNIHAEYTEYMRRLAKIEEKLTNLKNILQELTKKRELLKESETAKIIKETETKIFIQLQEYSAGIKNEPITTITKKLKKKLQLDEVNSIKTKLYWK